MTSARFIANAREHEKCVKAGNEAAAFWMWAIQWSHQKRTDGFLDAAVLHKIPPNAITPKKARGLAELCVGASIKPGGAGLFERADGGYLIHDFHDYPPAIEEEEAPEKPNGPWRRTADRVGAAQRARIMDRDGMVCQICSGPIGHTGDIEIDHILPVSRGGKTTDDNLRVTHMRCNRARVSVMRSEAGRAGGRRSGEVRAQANAAPIEAKREANAEANEPGDEANGLPLDGATVASLASSSRGISPILPGISSDPSETDPDPDSRPARGKGGAGKSGRGTSIPDDWAVSESDRAFAVSRGWAETKIADEAIHFAAHHRKTGGISKSWRQSWITWVMQSKRFERPAQGSGGYRNGPTRAIQPAAPQLFAPAKEYR